MMQSTNKSRSSRTAYSGDVDPLSGMLTPPFSRRALRRSSFFDLSKKAKTKLSFFPSQGITFEYYFMGRVQNSV
jgi:hypothetical protein